MIMLMLVRILMQNVFQKFKFTKSSGSSILLNTEGVSRLDADHRDKNFFQELPRAQPPNFYLQLGDCGIL